MIATTANLSDKNFLNDFYHFDEATANAGEIINQGRIIAAEHGLVALMGNGVHNDGYIEAKMGKVILASGEKFTMSFAGNDLISFAVDGAAQKGVS